MKHVNVTANKVAFISLGEKPYKAMAATGFIPRNETFHRIYNLTLSVGLFLFILPLFLIIATALLVTQGRSIFYFGPRLGRNRKLFHVIKFRTLDNEKAKVITKGGVLPPGTGIETPLGGFLRDTRLDELPQLLNVIFGDMNLCGPRPVRPEIAAIYRCEVPNYDDRFAVKPGLVGHTQAYMNHGVSKVIRGRYNALLVRSPVNYAREIAMIALVGLCVLTRGGSTTFRSLRNRIARSASAADVERAKTFALTFTPEAETSTGEVAALAVVAVDDSTLWLRDGPSTPQALSGRLEIRLPDGQLRWARVALDPLVQRDGIAFRYRPLSDFSYHIISRYLLQKVVVPHKSHLPITKMMAAASSLLRSRRSESPKVALATSSF